MTSDVRVLVVDDDVAVAQLLTEMVGSFGYTAHMVTSGVQALRAVRELCPQVVLLDVNMPNIDGGTVLERLRTSTPSPAVIIVTGDTNYEKGKVLLERGAFDFVTKPVDLVYLRRAIDAAVATRQ